MNRKEKILHRLETLGSLGPKRSLGQNFLVSDRVIERILFAVKSLEFTDVVEIGPGLGALTDDLLALGKPMIVVELDCEMAVMWRERAAERPSEAPLQVIEADALQVRWEDLDLADGALLVSNLPYQISSSVVIDRCVEPAGISRMVLMFQKEVAQRIAARTSTKEYGLLSAMSQTFWDVATVCDASGQDFFPAPQVSSRVLQFRRRKVDWLSLEPRASSDDYLKFVKAAFSHRRKLLARNLLGNYLHWPAEPGSLLRLNEVLAKHDLLPTCRAEELDAATFVRLYLSLKDEP